MSRIARVVVPGIPHHITQRGNRRQQVFFGERDYQIYIDLMRDWCGRSGVRVLAYCLMPNHVHLIAIPEKKESLAKGIGEAHRRYTKMTNSKMGWTGYLWQGRFASFPLDERHLFAATRYVELNPVRAGIAAQPWDYNWSSARARVEGICDGLVTSDPLLKHYGDWRAFLTSGMDEEFLKAMRRHERTGRPLGDESFILGLENKLKRTLLRLKPGPKKGLSKKNAK